MQDNYTTRLTAAPGEWRIIVPILIVLHLLLLPLTKAEAQQESERPAIGLALSGGSALGIAHLGLLKVMEESGLQPDYISGVSMGSLIGGMYSL